VVDVWDEITYLKEPYPFTLLNMNLTDGIHNHSSPTATTNYINEYQHVSHLPSLKPSKPSLGNSDGGWPWMALIRGTSSLALGLCPGSRPRSDALSLRCSSAMGSGGAAPTPPGPARPASWSWNEGAKGQGNLEKSPEISRNWVCFMDKMGC